MPRSRPIELAAALLLLLTAVLYSLPRFQSAQLQSRVTTQSAQLHTILGSLMAHEASNPHTDAGSEAWNTAHRMAAGAHNLRNTYSSADGSRVTGYYESVSSATPLIALRVQGAVNGVRNEVLWALAAPVPRGDEDAPFSYCFPREALERRNPGLDGEERWTWFLENPFNDLLNARFDISNGLTSKGVSIVWDRSMMNQSPREP